MRLLRAAVVLLVAALVLGGCGDDEPDPGDPGSTWTPTSKPETPTSEPVDPLTEAPEGETAQEFIRRWVALSNRMQETGETEAFLAVAGPDCDPCRDYAKRIQDIYDNDGYFRGGTERILSFKKESATQWVVTLKAEPTEYAEAEGAEPERITGGKYRSRLYLARVDGRWIVGYTEGVPL